MAQPKALSAAAASYTDSGHSTDLLTPAQTQMTLDINLSVINVGKITYSIDRRSADGSYFEIWKAGEKHAAAIISEDFGPSLTHNVSLGRALRLRWLAEWEQQQTLTFASAATGTFVMPSTPLGAGGNVVIAKQASAATVKAAFVAKAAVGAAGNIDVTGSTNNSGTGSYVITFKGDLANLHISRITSASAGITTAITSDFAATFSWSMFTK